MRTLRWLLVSGMLVGCGRIGYDATGAAGRDGGGPGPDASSDGAVDAPAGDAPGDACVPAVETCNGLDDDCDGEIDVSTSPLCPADQSCSDGVCRSVGSYRWDIWADSPGADAAIEVAVLPSGDIVVVGEHDGPIDLGGGTRAGFGGTDVVVAVYGRGGAYRWDRVFGGGLDDTVGGVATDADGNVCLTGSFAGSADFGAGPRTSAGNLDIFVVCLNPTGAPSWTRTFGSVGPDEGHDIAVHADGSVIVAGAFSDTVSFGGTPRSANGARDAVVLKLAPGGTYAWDRTFGDSGEDASTAIALAPGGAVVAGGTFWGSIDFGGGSRSLTITQDMFVVRLAADGRYAWDRVFGGPAFDLVSAVSVGDRGDIVVAGSFGDSVDFGGGRRTATGFQSGVAIGLLSDGSYRWDRTLGDDTTGVALDAAGRAYVVGWFEGTADFGGGTRTAASSDGFVVGLGPDGAHRWDRIVGGTFSDQANGVAVGGASDLYVVGQFVDTVDFGGGPRSVAGTWANAFLLALTR